MELISKSEPVKAKCPHCEKPFRYHDGMAVTPSGNVVVTIWCADCGTVISTHFAWQAKPVNLPDLSKLGLRM